MELVPYQKTQNNENYFIILSASRNCAINLFRAESTLVI